MWNPFSRRIAKPANDLRNDIPIDVRSRLLHTVNAATDSWIPLGSFRNLLTDMQQELLKQYGMIRTDIHTICTSSDHPAVIHFLNCDDLRALDFIELFFRHLSSRSCKPLVEEFNIIFRQENLGYELTPYEEIIGDVEVQPGNPFSGARRLYTKYPEIICKTGQYVHESIVHPCLDVLAKPVYSTAEKEMRKAHQHYRNGHFEDAITSCGSAFESVLKIICDKKGWSRKEKDTLWRLLEICAINKLFLDGYIEILHNSGKIRNSQSSAHGRGFAPPVVTKETVDHMIQVTSAHITFVAKLAAL